MFYKIKCHNIWMNFSSLNIFFKKYFHLIFHFMVIKHSRVRDMRVNEREKDEAIVSIWRAFSLNYLKNLLGKLLNEKYNKLVWVSNMRMKYLNDISLLKWKYVKSLECVKISLSMSYEVARIFLQGKFKPILSED